MKLVLPTLFAVGCSLAAGEPLPHFLSTNSPSFFFLNHGSGAMYYRFEPGGRFDQTAREHMGVMPLGGGTWIQDSNGLVTLTYGGRKGRPDETAQVRPYAYHGQTFLLWPDKSYASNLTRVMEHIDAANKGMVYNEFMISGAEFTNGTSKPYPFKYVRPPPSKNKAPD